MLSVSGRENDFPAAYRTQLIFGGFLLFGIWAVVYTYRFGYIVTHDDAYISFKYAANLAAGKGFVFNDGEKIWGYTSPLQTLLLAICDFIGFDIPRISAVLALIWISLTACVVYSLAAQVFSESWLLCFPTGLFVLANAVGYEFLGLETNLLIFLEVVFLWLIVARRHKAAAIIGSLACLTRPDAVILVLPVLLLNQESRKPYTLAFFALPGLVWLTFAYGYYGDILPNTFYGKKASSTFFTFLTQIARWLTDPQASADSSVTGDLRWWQYSVACLMFVLSIGGLSNGRFRSKKTLVYAFLCYPWILLIAYGIIGAPTAHRWEHFSAYFFFRAGVLFGLVSLMDTLWITASSWRIAWRRSARIITGIVWVSTCVFLVLNLGEGIHRLELQRNDNFYGGRYRDYWVITQWINSHLPTGASLMFTEIGTIGYYTDVRMIDMGGLVTKIGKTVKKFDYTSCLENYRPDYVLIDGKVPEFASKGVRYRQLAYFPESFSEVSR